MQIVIDIPEEIKQKRDAGKVLSNEEITIVCMAIKNGALLPKGHGKLIDEDVLRYKLHDSYLDSFGLMRVEIILEHINAVIEADRGDAE